MPPMAATFIFMASSCPRHLLGHLGKTRVAQAAPTATAATRPCEQFLRPEKATNESDLCSQSEVSGDLGPGGSEGWDGMLKCLNCGLRCIGEGEEEGERVKVIRPSPPKPIYLGIMDPKPMRTS